MPEEIDIETRLMIFAINHFGDHHHPHASPDNIGFFHALYAIECINRMIESPMVNDAAKAIGRQLCEAIEDDAAEKELSQ